MAITIVKESTGLVSDEALYATLDGRVVGEDDPEANTLISAAGRTIPPKLVERYGLKPGGVKAKAAKAEETPAPAEEVKAPPAETPAVTTRKIGTPAKEG